MVRLRLSLMMFLQYFAWGASYVTLGTYLSHTTDSSGARLFSDRFVGDAYGTAAIAAMIAPFFVGTLADRFFATEQLLAALHLAGAVLIYSLSSVRVPILFYLIALAYFLTLMPTLALTNSISLHHLRHPAREFPTVRVWGTIGWIVAGLLVGYLRVEATVMPMVISAATQVLLACFCLALPHTPPSRGNASPMVAGRDGFAVLEMMKDWSFAVFMIGSFLISIPLQFYYSFANPFLNELGVTNSAAKQTLGQLSEIGCMLLMPLFFRRLGVKWMLVVGMAAWALRYLLFALGNAGDLMWMLYGGILLHGVCYVLFFITGQIYVDIKAAPTTRASAQGFLTVVTLGLGQFVGSIISGRVVQRFAASDVALAHDWRTIWLVPAAMAGASLIFFTLAFRDRRSQLFPARQVKLPSSDELLVQLPHGTLD